ncbi:hypothetical protein pah_c045o070 [Parachlamydia acanthamoebae str. Hall's coccus]|nr:hypothetical protein pah_c045o070 [Parachlamydia acanthamoebae str. Hall's coccus]
MHLVNLRTLNLKQRRRHCSPCNLVKKKMIAFDKKQRMPTLCDFVRG